MTSPEPRLHLVALARDREHRALPEGLVLLDRNERVAPIPDECFARLTARVSQATVCRYPNLAPLLDRLGKATGLGAGRVLPTLGSDGAIRRLFQSFLRPGDHVVTASPTYAMYAIYAAMNQAGVCAVPYGADLVLDGDAVLRAIDAHRPRIVIFACPDQPTGAVLPAALRRAVAERTAGTGTLLVFDEAYYPFCTETALDLVSEHDHVAVLRSFSKSAGFAGLRIGYLAASEPVVAGADLVRGAHEVNGVAAAAALLALEDPTLIDSHLAQVTRGRRALERHARALGVAAPDCPTNFQLLQFRGLADSAGVVRALRDQGYLVKGPLSGAGLENAVRVTLGDEGVMDTFGEALGRALAASDAAAPLVG